MRRTQRQRAEGTRAALMAAAVDLFGREGYDRVSAESVAERAGMTTGALYYHFRDKKDLFRAVVEASEAAVARRVAEAAQQGGDARERLLLGVAEYFAVCAEPGHGRLLFLEAPSVLGSAEWQGLRTAHHLRPLRAAVASAMRAGLLPRRPPEPIAVLLSGALAEAASASLEALPDLRSATLWLLDRMLQERPGVEMQL